MKEQDRSKRAGGRRRGTIALAMSVLLLAAACLGQSRAGAQPLGAATATPIPMPGMGHGLTAPGRRPVRQDRGSQQVLFLPPSGKSPSWYDITRVYHTLSLARTATARYAREAEAMRAGYRRQPGLQAGMYATFTNRRNASRVASFDPRKPASLVYMEMGKITTLSAVGYTLPGSTTAPQLDGIFPASLTAWVQALNVCTARGSGLSASQAATIHTPSDCTARGGSFLPAGGWSITAWIWQPTMGLFESQPSGMSMGSPGERQIMDMTEEPYQMQMLMATGAPPSWADISKVYRVLSKAKAATQKYRDIAVAKREGFITAPYLYVPGQGAHYVSPRLLLSEHSFDPTKPPVLVYNQRNGKEVLSSLLYLMPDAATSQQMSAIFPASMAVWHRHINTCVIGDKVVAIHDRTACEQGHGTFLASTGWMVHAWLWQRNVGVFDLDM